MQRLKLSVTSTRALLSDMLVYLLRDGEGAHMESAIWMCKRAPDTRQYRQLGSLVSHYVAERLGLSNLS